MSTDLVHQLEEDKSTARAHQLVEDIEVGSRHPKGAWSWLIPALAITWSLFQLALPKLLLLESTHVRTIHLGFAISLAFLSFPTLKSVKPGSWLSFLSVKDGFHFVDIFLAIVAAGAALYLSIDYLGLAERAGFYNTRDIVIGFTLIALLLEASRRALGPALPVVALVFTLYAFFGPYMPDLLAFKGVSINRFIGQVTASTEGVYGVPLDVSANIVFLFVLFGAMLDKAGGGQYFVNLAFSLMGGFKGGPAKASIFASGCTGMISGSSIANTVTTGTFTIPLMKKVGFPAHKAGAVEVAASTNGQLTPPIMGAAAFIMAEYTGLSYFEVIVAAFVPAIVSYIGLFYIVHLEACKMGLKGLTREQLPQFFATLFSGLHYLIPLFFLIYQLMVMRRSPQLAAFSAIMALMVIIVIQEVVTALRKEQGLLAGLVQSVRTIGEGLASGGRNMIGIGVATATAGIVVAVVTMGLGGLINEIVAVISGGNLIALLLITAVASLILGMGLPTTANYIVMAALTAPLIVELGAEMGLVVPLIAAHLFVFYFGILADDTPPVGLAAYAASAISKADPIKTGLQGFAYDIRTAILPFMFIFNTEILLQGVDSIAYGVVIFVTCAFGMMAFTSAIQGWVRDKNRWYETIILLAISFVFFRPDFAIDYLHVPNKLFAYVGSFIIFGAIYLIQRKRYNNRMAAESA